MRCPPTGRPPRSGRRPVFARPVFARPTARMSAALLAASALAACAKRQPPPPLPAPDHFAAPGRQDPARARDGANPAVRSPAPPGSRAAGRSGSDLEGDPIVSSPWARHEGIEDGIGWWLNFWQNRESGTFQRSLARMGRYEEFVAAELAERGLPPSLRYLPVIEAAYNPTALSPAGAAGLWQFMPATARWLGLEVGPLVDQRLDPYAATPRAVDYLARLNRQFGSWFLTLAAYNSGPGRVERIIREHGSGRPRDDAMFWRIREKLPSETRNFVPKYLAAVRIAEDPAAFGLDGFDRDPPQVFDVVEVDGPASMDVIAEAAGTEEEDVLFLNPQLVRGLLPAGRAVSLRLPPGLGRGFAERFAAVPPNRRVSFVEHAVAAGETLSEIAEAYDVPLDDLLAANPNVEPRRLRVGAELVVPRPGVVAPSASRVHVVSAGESLWLIARAYDVSLDRLRRHNGLELDELIRPGDELRIPPS